jgi:hypothetical protein
LLAPAASAGVVGMDDEHERRLLDRVEIDGLLSAYADAISRRAFDELDDLFLPDCPIEVDTHRAEPIRMAGPAELGAFVGAAIERFDFFELVILNTHLMVDGGDEATGRMYMCELRHDRATKRRSEAFGLYRDRYRRIGGRWWFAERRYSSLARTADEGVDADLTVFPVPEG